MSLIIPFHNINPVAVYLGPLEIKWYGLAYIAGVLIGARWFQYITKNDPVLGNKSIAFDFATWALVGIVLGGRLGEMFYDPMKYLSDPLEFFRTWKGGMSFHGGFFGFVIVTIMYTKNMKIPLVRFGDVVACCAPFGIFFGRLANFINGELWGRGADVPWAMIFPNPRSGGIPRHPSQLYEAFFEGILLFLLTNYFYKKYKNKPGHTALSFIIGYACFRSFCEYFREPDPITFLNIDPYIFSMGQLLSVFMAIVGVSFVSYNKKRS